nr:MFS transporter [Winkia neuii]
MSMHIVRANRNVLIPLWGAHMGLSPTLISATFAISAALDVAMFYPAGRLQDRYGRLVALLPAYLIMGSGFLGLVLVDGKMAFLIFASLVGFGNGFGSGIVMTMGVDMSPDVYRERFLGWWTAITQAGSAAGPLFVAVLTDTVGLAGAMWATVAVAAVAALWVGSLFPLAYRRLGLNTAGRELTSSSLE